jgi:hypothetical protein
MRAVGRRVVPTHQIEFGKAGRMPKIIERVASVRKQGRCAETAGMR